MKANLMAQHILENKMAWIYSEIPRRVLPYSTNKGYLSATFNLVEVNLLFADAIEQQLTKAGYRVTVGDYTESDMVIEFPVL